MSSELSMTNKSEAQESSANIDNFVDPEARFECPICLTWLRDPILTFCGHRFCKSCMDSWLQKENPCCPVDNLPLDETKIFPDNFTRREISQQKVKCPNLLRGCTEELSPLDVEYHMNICKFKPPELPDVEKLRCMFVDFGCDKKFEDEPELQKHLDQDVQQHLALFAKSYSKAQSNPSSSVIAQQANFWDPPSKNESHPMASSNSDNVNDLLRALYEKIVVLDQRIKEQEIIISNMSEQIFSMNLRYCNGIYLWNFNDFKNKIQGMREDNHKMHYSPGFYTSYNGYRLCVRLNLSPKDPSYIALLIHIMKTDHDNALDWPFCGRLSITVVHPFDPHKNIKETMMTRPELDAFKRPVQSLNPKGFGYTEFALIEELVANGYVDKNQLLIKIHAQPV